MSARAERRLPPLALAAACAALLAAQLWTFHWGVITYDTVVQYRQVLSGHYEDWHPPITAFLWRMLGGARYGGAPLLLLDCALYWGGLLLIAEALRRRRHDAMAIAVIAAGALPIPFGQMGAVLKDPLLTACCLGATGLLAISPPPSHPPKGREVRPIALRLAGACLLLIAGATRFNAIFATAPLLLLCLAPNLWRRPRPMMLVALAGCALLSILASSLVTVALQPKRTEPIFSLVNFDLAGTSLFAGRSVYPAGADPGLPMLRHCYSPRLYGGTDYDHCEPVEDRLRAFSHQTRISAVSIWIAGVRQAPLAYLRHRLSHFDRNQRWLIRTTPDDAIFISSESNALGLHFDDPPAAEIVYRAAMIMAGSPFGRPATALAAALGLCLLAIGGRLPPLAIALAVSALLYGGAYAVVSVADDLRYNLWTMLAALLAWIIVLAETEWRTLPRGRRRLAVALPIVAASGEIVALML